MVKVFYGEDEPFRMMLRDICDSVCGNERRFPRGDSARKWMWTDLQDLNYDPIRTFNERSIFS